MSGPQFVDTLRQLGYPRAGSLEPHSVEWLFEENAAPFLDWFCKSVHSSNVLTEEELQEFSNLEQRGEGVLVGDQLENVLQTVNVFSDDSATVTKDTLKDDIERLTEDIRTYQQRKDILIHQRNVLSAHLTDSTQNASGAENCGSESKQEYREALEQIQSDNSTRNQSDARLVKSVNVISDLYNKQSKGHFSQQQQQDAVFLSQIDLGTLQKMEEKFNQEITNYSKKQFFEGIAEMTGQYEGSRYDMLEISDPKSLLVKGEDSDRNIKYSRELARLKSIYPLSERRRIESHVELSSQKSANEEAVSILKSLHSQPMSANASSLRSQIDDNHNACQSVQRDIADQIEDVLPNYIMQNAASQVLPIITGDYNLKIARQDYFTSNQDQLISHLVVQRSRNEFLSMAYEVESRNHRDVYRLLRAISSQLHTQESSFHGRMALMDDPALTANKYQRGTIDSRDHSALRLHSVLVPEPADTQQLYQKFSSLVEGAEKLLDHHTSTQTQLSNVFTQHQDHLLKLQKLLSHCESLVYSESTTSMGQPQLTPQPVLTAHTTLQRLLTQLEQTVVDVIKEVDQKKKVLKSDALVRTEREIFEMFLVSPDKLGKVLEQMTERIQAQMVH